MSQHFPALIIVVPLLTSLLIVMAGWLGRKLCFPLAVGAMAVSFFCSAGMLIRVSCEKVIYYSMAGWAPPVGISYKIDFLSAIVLAAITLVALVNLISGRKSVNYEFPEKAAAFYSLYVLFVAGLIGMVATGDAFNLYVLLEIASLTGYALIGIGSERSALSTLNYLFMGTIGASFYLLGVGYLYLATGTLNMDDLAGILPSLFDSHIVIVAFILCLAGLFMKMALFPLHGWLPNAYSFAPSAAAGVVAPLTTKVTVYVMARIVLYVFSPEFSFKHLNISPFIVWIAIIAIVMGAFMALAQRTLKKMLTYIIVAEVGYMVGGFWLGNRPGMTGAILHIINDAAMTLCVFLAAGAFAYKLESDDFESLRGLFRKMPFSMTAFVVGGLSIIGIPPTCGFFSKWYLISGGIAAGQYGFVAALIFSSLVNAVLFFRIFEICYFEPFQDGHGDSHGPHEKIAEVPLDMLIPLWLSAISLIVLGIYSGDIVTNFIQFAIPAQIF